MYVVYNFLNNRILEKFDFYYRCIKITPATFFSKLNLYIYIDIEVNIYRYIFI